MAIAAGAFQGLALKRDGTIVSWGQGCGANLIIRPIFGKIGPIINFDAQVFAPEKPQSPAPIDRTRLISINGPPFLRPFCYEQVAKAANKKKQSQVWRLNPPG
jgi:hypothetical protein